MVPLLVTDDVIRGPSERGRFAPVARTDVADVAVALLTGPTAPTGRFDVTGPELVTMEQAAALLTEVTGRRVTFEDETLEEAYASRSGIDVPQFEIDGWITSYRGIAAGEFEVLVEAGRDREGGREDRASEDADQRGARLLRPVCRPVGQQAGHLVPHLSVG